MIRLIENKDFPIWIELRHALWPYHTLPELEEEARKIYSTVDSIPVFFSENSNGEIIGFAEFSIHETAPGCVTKNVGFIEALYVKPEYRKCGIGKMLIENGEHWAVSKGCIEMASDTDPKFPLSPIMHGALSYEEVSRQNDKTYYLKKLCVQAGRSLDEFSIINIDENTYIRKTSGADRNLILDLMEKHWGGEPLVVNSKNYYPSTLNGILLFKNEEVDGFLFHDVRGNEYEIIVFEVFDKFNGLGTIMLNEFIRIVKDQNGDKILVMTTNDNLDALRFYQRRGFIIRGICINALEESRRMKPSIPKIGDYNIPLRDEIELELHATNGNEPIGKPTNEESLNICSNKQGEVFLETERLILRKLTPDDFIELCRVLKDPEVMYAWEHEFTDAEVTKWINENMRRYQIDGYSYCAAISKKTHELIGLIGLLAENIDGKKYAGIGYILKKEHWGNGYALEGAKSCIDYAFRVLNVGEVIADIRPENLSSQKVAERLGMKIVGQHTKLCYGKDMVHLIYELQ